jgi:hypothetical protein
MKKLIRLNLAEDASCLGQNLQCLAVYDYLLSLLMLTC